MVYRIRVPHRNGGRKELVSERFEFTAQNELTGVDAFNAAGNAAKEQSFYDRSSVIAFFAQYGFAEHKHEEPDNVETFYRIRIEYGDALVDTFVLHSGSETHKEDFDKAVKAIEGLYRENGRFESRQLVLEHFAKYGFSPAVL